MRWNIYGHPTPKGVAEFKEAFDFYKLDPTTLEVEVFFETDGDLPKRMQGWYAEWWLDKWTPFWSEGYSEKADLITDLRNAGVERITVVDDENEVVFEPEFDA